MITGSGVAIKLEDDLSLAIEFLHSRGIVGCDIKPHNFAMGDGENAQIVHMFDFGLAKTYLDPATGKHIPFSQGRRHAIGAVRYASVAAHNQHSVSRRDDIESLLYVLLEFYHGGLPWKALPAPDWDSKIDAVGEMKAGLAPSKPLGLLLSQSPPEFRTYIEHCVGLPYGRTPGYELLRGLFRESVEKEGWACDRSSDWMDGSAPAGTLLPEEYVLDWDLVKEKGWDPNYM
ncbi:kinase-like domain-containing protein [Trametes elegans]|nr:kinase-like domain-containing protein [Trametes elegans]